MRIRTQERGGLAIIYMLNLSANETYDWAHRPGQAWPRSMLSGHRLWVHVDQSGLCEIRIDGVYSTGREDLSTNELNACIGDHLPKNCKHLWPCWEIRNGMEI